VCVCVRVSASINITKALFQLMIGVDITVCARMSVGRRDCMCQTMLESLRHYACVCVCVWCVCDGIPF